MRLIQLMWNETVWTFPFLFILTYRQISNISRTKSKMYMSLLAAAFAHLIETRC